MKTTTVTGREKHKMRPPMRRTT